jgi:hypothetical protein
MPDSAVPRNAVAGVLVPLDLIGHASRRFDNALRLDPVLVRAVLSTELPATVTPNSGEGAKDAGPHSADRVIENERQTRSGTPPIARSDRAVTSLPETEPVASEPAGASGAMAIVEQSSNALMDQPAPKARRAGR